MTAAQVVAAAVRALEGRARQAWNTGEVHPDAAVRATSRARWEAYTNAREDVLTALGQSERRREISVEVIAEAHPDGSVSRRPGRLNHDASCAIFDSSVCTCDYPEHP